MLLCFRGSSTQTASQLSLSRLHPLKLYCVRLFDAGTESTVSGKELMDTGIYLSLPETGASEIVLIHQA